MSRFLLSTLWVVGALLLGQGLYMEAKAKLAQTLIAASWQQRTLDRPPPKPWWWADTHAIAKVDVVRLKQSVYVMQDASGESLAFGPGHMSGSSQPGQDGHVMIAGHRDSHFEFLQDVQIGDIINTSNYRSETKRYRVSEAKIIDSSTQDLFLENENLLSLITCYPFNSSVPGGGLRYVVNALEVLE